MNRGFATVGVDMDSVDLHLAGYGFRAPPVDPRVWTIALPRLLEAFAAHGVRATFFVVGRDAVSHAAEIAALAAAGHEVASHSLSHPVGLSALDDASLRREVSESRSRLEQAAGRRVAGFRAPSFDVDERVIDLVAACGYLYDASGYPTPWLPLARLALLMRARDPRAVLRLHWWPDSWRRAPFRELTRAGTLARFPLSVTPRARVPVYHTLRLRQRGEAFERTLDGFVARREDVSYALHAVDALGLAEDAVDPRLARHPGLEMPLAAKLAVLDHTLAALARRFETVPFADRLGAAGNESAVPGVMPAQPIPTGGNA
jgi:hypothetical protein